MKYHKMCAMTVEIVRRPFSVDEYQRMRETGILAEDDRVELIDGEVRIMSPVGPLHAAVVKRLNALLTKTVADHALISVQDPIRLDAFNEPQPDLAALRPRPDYYAQQHPAPQDVFFVIEVADTSREYDRREKLPRYAAAGIPEAWLIDAAQETIEQHLDPQNDQYTRRLRFVPGDRITSATLPIVTLDVAVIFGR
ncbi:MAG: Uma2 family endonuclease [Roseiflexus sp.]|nr:Uma2 family endonuclease [Roseiflexus sp.]MDW8147860.1 Uma2 family endonuclease [Roseiflexaceae bacterium]